MMAKLALESKIDRIASEFLANCLAYAKTRQDREFVAGNKFARKLSKLAAQLRHDFGDIGRQKLASFMHHTNAEVRTIAAADSLDFATQEAINVLETVASEHYFMTSVSAEYALIEWRAGRKEFPGGQVTKD
jgi:hypothetical protein